ncbi:NUDIX hydrolase [Fusobacterium sp. PH5-29]|uniref:NUDIX hydrolase n=1 Tax=Fusobacterium sp. PH5-29 TaxID=1742400 RepID=UPI003D1FD019
MKLAKESKGKIIGCETAIESAVFICFCKIDNVDYLILEKRAPNIRQGGEISFPGGKVEREDKSPMDTAVRETVEELGIRSDKIEVYGKYGVLTNPLGIVVHCYFGYINIKSFDELNPEHSEVERVISVPLEYFMNNEPRVEEIQVENVPNGNIRNMNIPEKYHSPWKIATRKLYFYNYKEEIIWGMTGGIIYDFVSSLKKL